MENDTTFVRMRSGDHLGWTRLEPLGLHACDSDAQKIAQTGGLDTTMMTFSVRFLREETWPDKGLPYYEALEQAGVAVPAIQGLSIRPRAVVLTLNDVGEYHRLLTNGFTFQEQHVQVTPEERRTTTSVHVFVDAGVEDEDLQRKLKTFGTVVGPITHKYDLYKGHRIDAGVRYVNMILKEVVPSFVEIEMSGGGKVTCRIWHNGQVKRAEFVRKKDTLRETAHWTNPPPVQEYDETVQPMGSTTWKRERRHQQRRSTGTNRKERGNEKKRNRKRKSGNGIGTRRRKRETESEEAPTGNGDELSEQRDRGVGGRGKHLKAWRRRWALVGGRAPSEKRSTHATGTVPGPKEKKDWKETLIIIA